MTLAGGAIFGLFIGTIIVSISSTIGATMAMINCRYYSGMPSRKTETDHEKGKSWS